MNLEWETLIEALEISINKNGEQPLTNQWLLNLMRLVDRKIEQDALHEQRMGY